MDKTARILFICLSVALAAAAGWLWQRTEAAPGRHLVILHTNDTHSHFEPERAGEYAGMGGIIERAAFVDILLYYIDPFSGEPSQGIPGTGGASFVAQERNGAYLSDECFKMALTDALSVACKALGVAADVYWQKDRTKYTAPEETPQKPAPQPAQPAQKAQPKPANTGSAQLATPEQKKMLRDVINLEQLAACNKMYGEDWGTMTANQCATMYNKIMRQQNGAAH